MNRWPTRIIGLLMLLLLIWLLMNLQKQLVELQKERGATTTAR
jgi:hypothetical protein